MSLTLDQDMLNGLTPMECRNGRWYKREDLLRYSNGVNGKVRTALWLARRARHQGADTLVYGGSVHAPALGRVASAAAYMGMKSQIVIGTDPARAVERHPTVRVAAEAGAELVQTAVAYNPALQKRVRELVAESGGTAAAIPYGVSAPESEFIEVRRAFLGQDGPQVQSLWAAEVRTLVLAFGSGNAASGVLWGLWKNPEILEGLDRIVLVGVGPDRRAWMEQHLTEAGVNLIGFPLEYISTYPDFAKYTDRMPEHRDGIDFHPLYEGKVVRYLDAQAPEWWTNRDGSTCFWIVGGPL